MKQNNIEEPQPPQPLINFDGPKHYNPGTLRRFGHSIRSSLCKVAHYIARVCSFSVKVCKTLVVALVLIIVADSVRELWKRFHIKTILIEPFGVPVEIANLGYSSKVLANSLADRCSAIINTTYNGIDLGQFSRKNDNDLPDIEVPETHMSLKAFGDYVTERLGHSPIRISGELVGPTNQLHLTVRIEPGSSTVTQLDGAVGTLDHLLDMTATNIVKHTHPYALACLFTTAKKRTGL